MEASDGWKFIPKLARKEQRPDLLGPVTQLFDAVGNGVPGLLPGSEVTWNG